MQPEYLQIPQSISFNANPGASFDLAPRLGFGFFNDAPAIGEPSKAAGEVILWKQNDTLRIQLSLGSRAACSAETFRKAGGSLGKWLLTHPAPQVGLSKEDIDGMGIPGGFQAFLEGLRLGAYKFSQYRSSENQNPPIEILIQSKGNRKELDDLLLNVQVITDAVVLAREWAHQPANVINPVTLAERAAALAEEVGLKCTVLDHRELEKLNAGAILAVGRGSSTPPRMIVVEYPGIDVPPGKKPVVLVGKTLTFDSGGFSIKTTEGIQGMKYDKCGGIAVLATLYAAAHLKLKTPIIGVLAAAENLISGDAYRPDDILTTLSGKTVEIISTDAEGRLVLADALTYTQRTLNPEVIIDLATLTGGVVTALGRVRAGIMGNHQDLIDDLAESGERTMERLWQLPLDEDYFQQIKGDDADLKNSGGREASPIIGGIFLKQFVDSQVPWAHIDIAGVADTPKDQPYAPKGATGFGIRLLIDYLQHR